MSIQLLMMYIQYIIVSIHHLTEYHYFTYNFIVSPPVKKKDLFLI